jgi:RND family efflux transporter MFP subunit
VTPVSAIRRIALVPALLVLFAFLEGCAEEPRPAPSHIPSVKTQVVRTESSLGVRIISAVVQADKTATLAFPIGGTVAQILVDLGDAVSKGQTLARIDPAPFEIALRSANAQVASARSSLLAASEQYRRLKTLHDQGIIPEVELDNQRAALNNAQSSLEVAQSQRVKAQDDLRRTAILAPFDGRIAEKSVTAFQEVGSGEAVLKMIDEGGLEARAAVPESLVRTLRLGGRVAVTFPTLPGARVDGTIAEIGASAGAGNAYPVLISLDREQSVAGGVLVGAAANVEFPVDAGDADRAFLVPLSALAMNEIPRLSAEGGTGGRAPIFVFLPEKSAVALRVVEVRDFSGNHLAVTSGLSENDEVVVAGASFLKDGMAARRWEPGTPQQGIVMSVSGPSTRAGK